MTYQPATIFSDLDTLPQLPGWITSGRAETLETVAFRSGAALTVLDRLIGDPRHGVPGKLLANRLALSAATATSKLEGRLAREPDIRDAWHLTPPGAARGPDGDLLAFWREAHQVRLGTRARQERAWQETVAALVGAPQSDAVEAWIAAAAARNRFVGPLTACSGIMTAVLAADDRAERVACLLSDLVLARALGWDRPLPLTALHLEKQDLRGLCAGTGAARLNIHRGIFRSVQTAILTAHDLVRRAAALRAVAPKLRAKGSAAAVDLFLSEDAVAPSAMLAPRIRGTRIAMTDRAARRLCDRLVDLDVVRELTGRSTFRLYGL